MVFYLFRDTASSLPVERGVTQIIKAAAIDMNILQRSKFSRSLVHKKKFSLI